MASITVTSENFQEEVLNSDKTVIVDFWAEWCGPCKMIAPHLDEISLEMADQVKIVKIDVDSNPDLAVQYGIRSMPTLVAFKGGEQADVKIGADSKSGLTSWIGAQV